MLVEAPINFEPCDWLVKIYPFEVFIKDMLKVLGKFLRFDGKVEASLLNEGLESSFLSSISLKIQ